MRDSVRVRLTLWYTGVLALLLIFMSVGTYWLVALTVDRRTYISMAEISQGFLATFQSEYKNQSKDKAGPEALQAAAVEAGKEFRLRDHRFAVVDSAGNVLAENQALVFKPEPNWAGPPPEIPTEVLSYLAGRKPPESTTPDTQAEIPAQVLRDVIAAAEPRRLQQLMLGGERFQARVQRGEVGGAAISIVTFQLVEAERLLLENIRQTLFWMIPVMLLIASGGGYFLARKSLAPVEAMRAKAAQMGAQNLSERLPVLNPRDELGRLASTFNDLLERLNLSFELQRRFMADASHELRSPVSIIRGEAEVALSQARTPAEYRESLGVSLEEARRLSQIVDDLLTLARADAGQYPLHPSDFYLEELAGDCVRSARSMAAAHGITLRYEPDGEMPVHADEGLLKRLVMNLLDNAIKYTPKGGSVHVACEHKDNEFSLSVNDSGPGIPAEAREKIFERFFRLDPARTQERHELGPLESDTPATAGAGLGLAIARWIAEAHEGRLVLAKSGPSGSAFAVFLPASRTPAAEPKGAMHTAQQPHAEPTRA